MEVMERTNINSKQATMEINNRVLLLEPTPSIRVFYLVLKEMVEKVNFLFTAMKLELVDYFCLYFLSHNYLVFNGN